MKASTAAIVAGGVLLFAASTRGQPSSQPPPMTIEENLESPSGQQAIEQIRGTYGDQFADQFQECLKKSANAAEAFACAERIGQQDGNTKQLLDSTGDIIPSADFGRYTTFIQKVREFAERLRNRTFDRLRDAASAYDDAYQAFVEELRYIRSSILQDARNRESEGLITYEQRLAQEDAARRTFEAAFAEVQRLLRKNTIQLAEMYR